jgi:hypothetical protein
MKTFSIPQRFKIEKHECGEPVSLCKVAVLTIEPSSSVQIFLRDLNLEKIIQNFGLFVLFIFSPKGLH